MARWMVSLAAIALIGTHLAVAAQATEPLVEASWLATHSCDKGIAVIDVRRSPRAYARAHVPCARYLPYQDGTWRTTIDEVPGMLPTIDHIGGVIAGLGIRNTDHVVIVAAGGSARAMTPATRVFWTFKVVGHRDVSLLNGGMAAYRADLDRPVQKGEPPVPTATNYVTSLSHHLVAAAAELPVGVDGEPDAVLIDNRESADFVGINASSVVARPGTIPNAENLPISWLTSPDGRFHDQATLRQIYAHLGITIDQPQISFCSTGQMATLGWFVSHALLGNDRARVYDGSMAEWSADEERPVERKFHSSPSAE